jgi:hypothetical protein
LGRSAVRSFVLARAVIGGIILFVWRSSRGRAVQGLQLQQLQEAVIRVRSGRGGHAARDK